jgi:hypothetical protein
MTTLSAGAAAGLLVALMVVATSDARGAEVIAEKSAAGFVHPGETKGFNPQPDPPREIGSLASQADAPEAMGDGSVRPAGR